MNDGPSAIPLRSALYRNMADIIRARASRLRHPAIRQELSALAADYERLAELEAKPFAAWPLPTAVRLVTVDHPPLRWEQGWLQLMPTQGTR